MERPHPLWYCWSENALWVGDFFNDQTEAGALCIVGIGLNRAPAVNMVLYI